VKNTKKIESNFNDIYAEQADPWSFLSSEYEAVKYKKHIELIKSCFIPNEILEIGCGIGAQTKSLAEAFPNAHITGVDLSENAIDRAKKFLSNTKNIDLYKSDIFEFLCHNNTRKYDLVIWSEGFDMLYEYYTFKEYIDLVKNINNVLFGGGMVCISHIIDIKNKYRQINTPKTVLDFYNAIFLDFFELSVQSFNVDFKIEDSCEYEYVTTLYKSKLKKNKDIQTYFPIERVDIVIPAKDEEDTISTVINEYKNLEYVNNIIVVDNNSVDNTANVAKKCGATVVKCNQRGYGSAVKMGINSTSEKWIFKIDADIENPNIKWLVELIKLLNENYAPLIKTCWKPTIEDPDRVTNFTAKPFLNVLYPDLEYLQSPLSGIYLFCKDFIDFKALNNDYSFDIGMLVNCYKEGYKINQHEIEPVIHASVASQKRTINHYMRMSEEIVQYFVT